MIHTKEAIHAVAAALDRVGGSPGKRVLYNALLKARRVAVSERYAVACMVDLAEGQDAAD